MPANLPVVLLIHGVNSTGEWHDATINECRGIFECRPVKYRYYHGITGPLKVYIWPTAVILLFAVLLTAYGMYSHRLPLPACSIGLAGVLLLDVILVATTEWSWSKSVVRLMPPLLYLVAGCAGLLWPADAERVALLLGSIAATSLFLDLEEYGFSFVAATTWSLLVLACVAGFAYWLIAHAALLQYAWTAGTLFVLMGLEPSVRRSAAFRNVRKQIGLAVGSQDTHPHVIAHSLGTYLSGHIINESRHPLAGRVIFTGCVLEAAFPWRAVFGSGRGPTCWSVKNYVGEDDPVPIMTDLLRRVWVFLTGWARGRRLGTITEWLGRRLRWRPLGGAGQRGFATDDPVVHSIDADRLCQECLKAGAHAPVHNVTERFAGHSTLNQDSDYQCFNWLPYFWGSSPDKYDFWKEICRVGFKALEGLEKPGTTGAEKIRLQNDLAMAERNLNKGPWYWPADSFEDRQMARGRSLREYVEETLANSPHGSNTPTADTVLKRLPRFVFELVAQGLAEKKRPDPRPEVLALLDPGQALLKAYHAAVELGP